MKDADYIATMYAAGPERFQAWVDTLKEARAVGFNPILCHPYGEHEAVLLQTLSEKQP
jgi:hypothetical protein